GDRAGGWGFAIYDPSGNPKENDLECAACHTPLANQEFMFTYSKLASHAE
ncbi:MAG: cytochrome P460 family protein, partial [Gammaproteobacteria bacterium]|nr:cytochrome P460 family protein [Gammaproteobacteria bacterium]